MNVKALIQSARLIFWLSVALTAFIALWGVLTENAKEKRQYYYNKSYYNVRQTIILYSLTKDIIFPGKDKDDTTNSFAFSAILGYIRKHNLGMYYLKNKDLPQDD